MTDNLCTNPNDEYFHTALYVHREARWVAKLANGLTIYQDDYRDNKECSAWLRLRTFCYNNKVNINHLYFQFFDHVVDDFLPKNAAGYFFKKGMLKGMFGVDSFKSFIGGYICKKEGGGYGPVKTFSYTVPELIFKSQDERILPCNDKCIILNSGTLECLNIHPDTLID